MMEKPPVIEVEGVTISRSGERVIEDATFKVLRGDFVGVVGPNGGGKTTLLKATLGLLPRDSGIIRLFGEPVERFKAWKRIAYVGQDSVNFDQSFPLSVQELVGLGRINRENIGRRLNGEDWRHVNEILEFMGIGDLADKRIGRLSGGQKQRVFVAKAMVRDPEVLFLDEPVAGVDPETQERFYMKLSNLNTQRGTTIIDVSHDLSAVFCRMSRVICVNREVNVADIGDEMGFTNTLKKAYGDHFHFVFHEHICEGLFEDDGPD
jgi:zinc transport system ATP-binding protein